MATTEWFVGARGDTPGRIMIMMLDGSHLFPMQKPLAEAAAIESALRNMLPARSAGRSIVVASTVRQHGVVGAEHSVFIRRHGLSFGSRAVVLARQRVI